jgi:hypothetical protein
MKLIPAALGIAAGVVITTIWGRGAFALGAALVLSLLLLLGPGELRPWVATPAARELPREYRFAERVGLRVAVMLVPLAILVGGMLTADTRADAAAAVALTTIATVAGVTALVLVRRRHQRRIIASVERRAAQLRPDELRTLVTNLEVEHGRLEMRHLRRLLD